MRGIGISGLGIGSGSSVEDRVTALLASLTEGVFLDPRDAATRFQEHAGYAATTTASQTIGLLLDKRIDTARVVVGGSVWTRTAGDGVLSVSGNVITVTGATTPTYITRGGSGLPFVPGQARLKIRADYSGGTGVQVWLRGVPSTLQNGAEKVMVHPLNNSTLERLDVATGTVSFTVTELSYWRGNHASQATSTARPLFQTNPDRVVFDGIDDALIIAFPVALGADCTIVRAIPGVGAQILTAQNIGTSYTATTTHAGELLINRALTPAETELVTQWANARSF